MRKLYIGVAGVIASGKTTVTKAIAQNYSLQVLSFGGVLREYCLRNSIIPSRSNLQNLGQNLITQLGQRGFMHWTMENASSISWKNGIILDGFRHKDVYKEFKFIFPNSILIFCDCPKDAQVVRICQRDKISPREAREIIEHPSEQDIKALQDSADFIFTPQDTPQKLIEWIANKTKISLTTVQKQSFINNFGKDL